MKVSTSQYLLAVLLSAVGTQLFSHGDTVQVVDLFSGAQQSKLTRAPIETNIPKKDSISYWDSCKRIISSTYQNTLKYTSMITSPIEYAKNYLLSPYVENKVAGKTFEKLVATDMIMNGPPRSKKEYIERISNTAQMSKMTAGIITKYPIKIAGWTINLLWEYVANSMIENPEDLDSHNPKKIKTKCDEKLKALKESYEEKYKSADEKASGTWDKYKEKRAIWNEYKEKLKEKTKKYEQKMFINSRIYKKKLKEKLFLENKLFKTDEQKSWGEYAYDVYKLGNWTYKSVAEVGKRAFAFFQLVDNVGSLYEMTMPSIAKEQKQLTMLQRIAPLLEIGQRCAGSYLNVVTIFNLNNGGEQTKFQKSLSWFEWVSKNFLVKGLRSGIADALITTAPALMKAPNLLAQPINMGAL